MTRKMTAILLVVALVVAMAVPASAATADSASVASLNTVEWYKTYMNNEYSLYFRIIPTGKARIINYDAAPDVTVGVHFYCEDEADNPYEDYDYDPVQAQLMFEGDQCFLNYGYADYMVNGHIIADYEEDYRVN